MTTATERTPLRQAEEFNELIREQDDQETLFTLLQKRPFSVAQAFSLFCLLLLTVQAVPQLLSYDWSKVPQYSIKAVNMRSSPLDPDLLLSVQADLSLDFSGPKGAVLESSSSVLQFVTVEFKHTAAYYNDSFVTSPEIIGSHRINLTDTSELELDIRLSQIGRGGTIQILLDKLLRGEELEIEVRGEAVISRFGVTVTIPFKQFFVYGSDDVPKNSASLQHVQLGYIQNSLSASVTSQFYADSPFKVTLELPATNWSMKLSDCDGKLCKLGTGYADAIRLDLDQANNITVNTLTRHLPADLTAFCPSNDKSPIDNLISRYLNGKQNHLFIEGSCQEDSFICMVLNDLDFNIPIAGKPLEEKLVDLVQVREVIVNTEGEFSGELTVMLHLPDLLDVDSSAVIGAQNVKGTIILSHNGTPFGKVIVPKWNPTVTTKVFDSYLVSINFRQVPFEILDAREAALVSRNLVLSGKVPVEYDALMDVDVISPIAQFFLTDVFVKGDTTLERA